MALSRTISAAEWQQHEETIRFLYMVENITREELKTEMAERHGFLASLSQYTSKLKEWGCKKNTTAKVYETVGWKLKKKGLDVDDAAVYINQQLISSKKLKREVNRYSKPSWEMSLAGASPRTPEGVSIHVKGECDDRLLWLPALPFFDLLQVLQQFIDQGPSPVHATARVKGFPYSLQSVDEHAELLMPRPANDLDPTALLNNSYQESPIDVPYYTTSQGSRQGLNGREAPATSYTTIDSKALVANWFSTSVSLDLMKQEDEVFSRIEPLTIDKVPGETLNAVRTLLGPPSKSKTPVLIAYVAYLSTNSLLNESHVDRFLEYMLQQPDSRTFSTTLAKILDSSSSTGQSFTTYLLHSAVRLNAYKLIAFLLEHGVDIDRLSNGWLSQTPLQCALRKGEAEMASFLIESGADVNGKVSRDSDDEYDRDEEYDRDDEYDSDDEYEFDSTASPMVIACRDSRTLRLIPTLLKHGAHLPQTGIVGDVIDSLHFKEDNEWGILLLKLLIEAGADVNCCEESLGRDGFPTAIQIASYKGSIETVRLLLDSGAHPDGPIRSSNFAFLHKLTRKLNTVNSSKLMSPLTLAAEYSLNDDLELLDLLLKAGADVNVSILDIHKARGCAPEDTALDAFSDWDWNIRRGVFTPLQAAVYDGSLVKTEFLLRHGADVETCHGILPLAIAAGNGKASIVRLLLQYGADVNACSGRGDGITALIAAATYGEIETLALLLESGASVDHYPRNSFASRTALQAAAEKGHTAAMIVLLDAGANVNACCASRAGIDALQGAVLSGNHDNVHLILGYGAHVNPCCISKEGGGSALHAAAIAGELDLVQLLLSLGARVNELPRHSGLPCLLQAAVRSGSEDIVRLLLEKGAIVNSPANPETGETALQIAVEKGSEGIVHILLEAGAYINTMPLEKPSSAMTALGSAIATDNLNLVCVLIEKGADVSMATNFEKESPVYASCSKWDANEGIVKVLIDAGADVNDSRHKGHSSPLVIAILSEQLGLAEMLITHGADVNFRSSLDFHTPLQVAAQKGNVDYARRLVGYGADVNTAAPISRFGRTALQAAAKEGSMDMVTFLISKGADVNAPAGSLCGVTALQAVAIHGYLRLAQLLLHQGADVGAPASPKEGRTAIDGAAENGRLDMLKYLLDSYKGDQTKAILCEGALSYAKRGKQWDAVRLLERYPSCA